MQRPDILIAVPSYRRAERLMERRNTLDFISERWRENVMLFVRDEEEADYLPVAVKYGMDMKLIPFYAYSGKPFGWGHTMDYMMNYAAAEGYTHLITIDDDLTMAYRPEPKKYITFRPEHFDLMMESLITTDENIPLAGILPRQYSQDHVAPIEYNGRIMQLFSFYMPAFRDPKGFRFAYNGPMYMSDLYFTLRTLQAGIRNKVFTAFTRDDVFNAPGGCEAVGRTTEEHAKSAVFIRNAFPDLVTLRVREPAKNNKNDMGCRVGTIVKWSKAFKEKGI